MNRFFLLPLLFMAFLLPAKGAQQDSLHGFRPKIEGTIRAKYEYNTSVNAHRFQVRNARFSINGKFSPIISYKSEIDLSDEGVTKMLDAYIRLQPSDWFCFTLGQQKIPFGTDNLRSPHRLYFANRSFVGKQLAADLRDVGATVLFANKPFVPFNFQAGIYNGDGLYNQQKWQKTMNYSFRLEAFPVENWEISLNFNSIRPHLLRMNLFDIGTFVDIGNLHLEGEYIFKTYAGNAFQDTHSYSVFGAYDIGMNKRYLTKITPLVRFDAMTNNNRGKLNEDTDSYTISDHARKRITGGVTFSFGKPFLNDIRLNYEKYFYADGNNITGKEDDKLVLEFVVRF